MENVEVPLVTPESHFHREEARNNYRPQRESSGFQVGTVKEKKDFGHAVNGHDI